MGAWGTGIFDDDTTCDVRDDYFDLLAEGLTAEEASKSILDSYHEEFNDEEDLEVMTLVYLGLAGAQLKKTITLIDSGAELALWEDSNKEDLEERKKVLAAFKQKLLASS
ncbi:MarR family transcriptional regulator [Paenibacillus glycanilyticus]|uniref:MarR family transcriptional regulator n=1 Tax=Paenibacillus glycanilyticus TaxID=126569 RepID=UPI001910D043|nr:MarR family transcriptional regulator [Paenibacillus glycanilyticus]